MATKPSPFPLQAVRSSNVAAVGYDASTERFGVQFKSGATYHYTGVKPEVANKITAADSVGSAVSRLLVKGGYAAARLEPEEK